MTEVYTCSHFAKEALSYAPEFVDSEIEELPTNSNSPTRGPCPRFGRQRHWYLSLVERGLSESTV